MKGALVVLVVVFGGLAVARSGGLLLVGEADAYNLRALAYEGTSLLLGAGALLTVSRQARAESAA